MPCPYRKMVTRDREWESNPKLQGRDPLLAHRNTAWMSASFLPLLETSWLVCEKGISFVLKYSTS